MLWEFSIVASLSWYSILVQHYNHVTLTPIAKTFMLYCRLIYVLSMQNVRLTIKVKVGIPESFKVGWYCHKITGSSQLNNIRYNCEWLWKWIRSLQKNEQPKRIKKKLKKKHKMKRTNPDFCDEQTQRSRNFFRFFSNRFLNSTVKTCFYLHIYTQLKIWFISYISIASAYFEFYSFDCCWRKSQFNFWFPSSYIFYLFAKYSKVNMWCQRYAFS